MAPLGYGEGGVAVEERLQDIAIHAKASNGLVREAVCEVRFRGDWKDLPLRNMVCGGAG